MYTAALQEGDTTSSCTSNVITKNTKSKNSITVKPEPVTKAAPTAPEMTKDTPEMTKAAPKMTKTGPKLTKAAAPMMTKAAPNIIESLPTALHRITTPQTYENSGKLNVTCSKSKTVNNKTCLIKLKPPTKANNPVKRLNSSKKTLKPLKPIQNGKKLVQTKLGMSLEKN